MAIFPVIEVDPIVQTGDKIRISLKKTYKTPGEAAYKEVRISPDADTAAFVIATGANVANQDYWYLDWEYSTSGVMDITVEIDYNDPVETVEKTVQIEVLTPEEDMLFSKDSDLVKHQHDILNFVPDGRSSWKYVHRRAQELILAYFDESGVVKSDGSKVQKADVLDMSEVKELSIFKTLRLIYESISNSPDDYFMKKAGYWYTFEGKAQDRCITRLDLDGDGDSESLNNNIIIAERR